MKYSQLAIIILSFFLSVPIFAGQPDPRYEIFKRTDDFTIKLTVARLHHAFLDGNLNDIAVRLAENYTEQNLVGNSINRDKAIGKVSRIIPRIVQENGGRLELSFKIKEIDRKGDSASVLIEMGAYNLADGIYSRRECSLRLRRLGGGWQVFASDGWLSKMELFLIAKRAEEPNTNGNTK